MPTRERRSDSTHPQHVGPPQRGGVLLPPGVTHEDLDKIRPATDVRAETTYGLAPVVGDDDSYARAKHGHGTPPLPRAVGAHVQHAAAVAVADNTNVIATGMVVEHDSGGIAGTDRLTVPTGGAGVWHVEVHCDWNYKFPDPHEFNVSLFLKRGGSTVGLWSTGATSFTRAKQFGTHFPVQDGDFFQVNMYHLSGASRNCQISCLSGYRIGLL